MAVFIQIGAGAGDLDYSANFRDGFSHFIKNHITNESDTIIVIEANPFNIQTLEKSWEHYKNVTVLNSAIALKGFVQNDSVPLYYVLEDAPFFQRASIIKEYVRKTFPLSNILSLSVPQANINEILERFSVEKNVELLGIDIEGLDFDVVREIDFFRYKIHKISFEKIHGGETYRNLKRYLRERGYRFAGSGLDPHNSDVLWVKPKNLWESFSIGFSGFTHKLWEVQIPLRHWMKSLLLKIFN